MTFQTQTERDNFIIENLGLAKSVVFTLRRARGCYPHTDEDLCQIAYMLLTQAADKFNPDMGTAFSTYAWTFIKNGLLNEIKKCQRRQEHFTTLLDPEVINEIIDETIDDEPLLSEEISSDTLYRAFDRLDARQQYVLTEHILHDKTFKTLGEELGITKQRTENIYSRARKNMRKHIDKLRSY